MSAMEQNDPIAAANREMNGLRVNGQLVSKLLQPIPGEGEKTDA